MRTGSLGQIVPFLNRCTAPAPYRCLNQRRTRILSGQSSTISGAPGQTRCSEPTNNDKENRSSWTSGGGIVQIGCRAQEQTLVSCLSSEQIEAAKAYPRLQLAPTTTARAKLRLASSNDQQVVPAVPRQVSLHSGTSTVIRGPTCVQQASGIHRPVSSSWASRSKRACSKH